MADKGFNLKVLIPTDDGIVISAKGVENASYYLMYNVSNRSYQLAGKIKTSDYYDYQKFNSNVFDDLYDQNKIDKLIDFKDFPNSEISEILNGLIDSVNKETS